MENITREDLFTAAALTGFMASGCSDGYLVLANKAKALAKVMVGEAPEKEPIPEEPVPEGPIYSTIPYQKSYTFSSIANYLGVYIHELRTVIVGRGWIYEKSPRRWYLTEAGLDLGYGATKGTAVYCMSRLGAEACIAAYLNK